MTAERVIAALEEASSAQDAADDAIVRATEDINDADNDLTSVLETPSFPLNGWPFLSKLRSFRFRLFQVL